MIKKILFFGDNYSNYTTAMRFDSLHLMKSSSIFRLSYELRKKGYKVKQVHKCLHFDEKELDTIITNFAGDDEIVSCISTSFISTTVEPGSWGYWGQETHSFLMKILPILKKYNIKILMGGWIISENMFRNPQFIEGYDINVIKKYVDYFVTGNSIDIIEKVCNSEYIKHNNINGAKIANSSNISDFTDAAFTPLPEDNIFNGESLITEIGAGCVFSCQFCDYAALGKKKYQFMRSYESLKTEIVSNYENFGTRVYTFSDNIMNDYDEKLKYLIRIKDETGIDLRWTGFIRLDTIVKKEQAVLLKESGIASAYAGIESLKKEVGPYIGKVTDKSRIIDCLELLRSVIGDNALLDASFILGLPTETVDDCYKSFEWINSTHGRELMDSVSFSELILYHKNKDKNTINIARNDPFRDYVGDYRHWTSPWGNSDIFFKLSTEFNSKKRNSPILGFSTALIHNTGVDIDDLVKISRKKDLENENRLKKYLIRKTPIIENTYKNFILQRE